MTQCSETTIKRVSLVQVLKPRFLILIVHGTFTAAERPKKIFAMYFYGPAADA